MAHLLAAAGPAASPGPFTAPLGLGLPLPGLTFSVWTQVTMEPPWRAGGMTRTGWARVPTGRSCRWGFSEPRGPSRCRPNSLSTWADSAQAPLCPAVWGLDTGRRKPEPALTGLALGRWPQDPRSRSVSWAPMEPTAAEAGALPCTFQRTSEGFPSLAVPPRHPWCWLWGHSPPQAGVKDTLSTIRSRNQGPWGTSLLGC